MIADQLIPFIRCDNPKCFGNPKTKELTALQAPTVQSVFKQRYEELHGQTTTLTDFKGLKPHSSTQKSLESLSLEIKRILKDELTAKGDQSSD